MVTAVPLAGFDSDTLAILLYEKLIEGFDFGGGVDINDPEFDFPLGSADYLTEPVKALTLDELTSGKACGDGAVDRLVAKMRAVLTEEFNAQRITQAEYSKTLIELMDTAVTAGTQFLLSKDQARWAAIKTQLEAAALRVDYETSRMSYNVRKAELQATAAQFALTKLKLATEDMTYGTAKYQVDNILPAQKKLIGEQTEVQVAQTLDKRTDGITVAGSVGKQKDLYSQQITSYQRDSEVKAARPFIDAWITMKTTDETLLPPNGFTNTSLDQVLTKLKTENGFGP